MAISLLDSNITAWASEGQIEEVSLEKRKIGWTGSTSDYAYNVWINSIWNSSDKRMNEIAACINKILQKGVAEFNTTYTYSEDSFTSYQGRLFRARSAFAGKNNTPPTSDTSDDKWELIIGKDYFDTAMALKADLASPALSGTPTTPTIRDVYCEGDIDTTIDFSNKTQIANAEFVERQILSRIRGSSVIDLTSLDSTKAYPILLAKNNLATDTLISRNVGLGDSKYGNMRLVIKGIGNGYNGRNNSTLEVENTNDDNTINYNSSYVEMQNMNDISTTASVKNFVKKVQMKNGNSIIAVWLRGGVKYNITQRNSEMKWQLVTETYTLNNNWVVSVEAWDDSEYVKDGVWSATTPKDWLIDYTSISDTGNIETCGMVTYFAGSSDKLPLGSLVADGGAVSRITYAKLFEKIGIRYGAGDGSTTFNLPDCRGLVISGIDLGKGYDSNELVTAAGGGVVDSTSYTNDRTKESGIGSIQTDAIRNIGGGLWVDYFFACWGANRVGWIYNYGGYGPGGSVRVGSEYTWRASNIVPTTGDYNGGWGARTDGGGTAGINGTTAGKWTGTKAGRNQVCNIAMLPIIYYI